MSKDPGFDNILMLINCTGMGINFSCIIIHIIIECKGNMLRVTRLDLQFHVTYC